MMVKPLIWDSKFFNKNIGEIYLDEFENINISNINNFDILYVKSKDDRQVKFKGFKNTFVENKVTFSKTMQNSKIEVDDSIKSVFEVDYNIDELYKLAIESGKCSRFKLDKNFSVQNFNALFKAWIDNTLNKAFEDDILVYYKKNKIIGFITYKLNFDKAKVGLFGICPSAQNKGIGTRLLQNLEYKLSKKGIVKINIPTQLKNTQAFKFYKKQGYDVEKKVVIKHYWKL